jgi:hypothetical protein
VTSVLRYKEVPDKKWFLLHSTRTLNHWGRLHLACFLWGNGIDPPTIDLILKPLVKINSQTDIQGVIALLVSRKYDNSWWYFSTRHQINLKLNDELHDTVNDYTRYKIAHYEYIYIYGRTHTRTEKYTAPGHRPRRTAAQHQHPASPHPRSTATAPQLAHALITRDHERR